MEAVKIEGTIVKKFPIEQKTEKFSLQRVWITEDKPEYPNTFEIQSLGKTLGVLDSFAEGDKVIVHANVNGKLIDKKDGTQMVFNSLGLWKIEKSGTSQAPQNNNGKVNVDQNPVGGGDLPF